MKRLILSFILLSYLFGCSANNEPVQPEIHKSNVSLTVLNWESLNYPINKDKNLNKVFNIITNSANDLFASDNSNTIYIRSHIDGYWRKIKKYYNLVSFIFINNFGKIFIGINSNEGMFGSYVESLSGESSEWETIYTSQNNINNLSINNDTLFLAKYGGIAVSGNNGNTWEDFTNGLENINVMNIAINKKTGSYFAGTWTSGILKSVDKGKTWEKSGFLNGAFFPILSLHNGFLFALSNGIFRSTNDGNTWEQLTNGLSGMEMLCITSTSDNYIFVGTRKNGIFLSKNYGDRWDYVGFKNIAVLSLCTDSTGYVYVGTDSHGIFKSKKPFVN